MELFDLDFGVLFFACIHDGVCERKSKEGHQVHIGLGEKCMNITEVGFIALYVWLSKVLHRVARRYPLKLIDDLLLLLFTNVISSNQRIIPDCSKSHFERCRCNEASRISFVMITHL